MADTKVVPISGVGRPTPLLIRMAMAAHGANFAHSIDSMLDDAVMVNALAGMIDRALVAGTAKDGRLDLKETAIALIREMRRHQK